MDGFLHGAIGVMEHDDSVAPLESPFREGPSDLLKDDCSGGGGVVDNGDFIDVVRVDDVLDQGSRTENRRLETVEVEMIGLAEI